MKRIATASLLACVLAAPVFAQGATTSEFYVVQDTSTKKCTIVDKKPTESTMTVVNPSGTVYRTRTEAEAGLKSIKVCTTN